MDPRNLDGPAGAGLHLAEVAGLLDAIPPHATRVIAGLDAIALAERLAMTPPRRPVLLVKLDADASAADLVRDAIAQLAEAVAALWPFLWDGEDFSELRDDALSRAHLPIRLESLASRVPHLSRPGATRISVINFSGLEAEASRQDFVNQLQMALFSFIKRHPSATPRLYVCDEAQNFAPSMAATASKASAIALARQGRKFGLGMIFATQAPKGIDTNIVSNCVTHFYGRMSSPVLIDATEDMMAARGKAARDLGTLTAGTFYFSTEGTPAPVKIKTPLCLSWHPQNPASPEEVVALARGE